MKFVLKQYETEPVSFGKADHAGHDVYQHIAGVVEIEEGRDGKKTIPAEWDERN